jgi:hypothetical protein
MASKQVIFDVLAVAKAEGFDAAAAKVDKLNDSATRSQKNMHLLSTSIVALGPALIPVAAAGAAALTGLGATAGVALLAFEGLKKEWENGTLQATALGRQITTLQSNLGTLEQTAASGVAPGLTKGLQDINGLMPLVNRDVQQLSAQLGQIAGNTGAGLVTLFTRLNPLFTALGDDLVRGSAGFEKWAQSSTGVQSFVDYALSKLPEVEQTFKDLVVTGSHLIQAFAPFGGTALTTIRLFSEAVNQIPVSVLQQLAPLIVGLKVASTASAALNNLSISMGKVAVSTGLMSAAQAEAAGSAGALAAAFGPLAATATLVVGGVELLKYVFPQLNSILSVHTLPAVNEQTAGMDALTTAYRNAHNGIDGTGAQLLTWGTQAKNATVVTDQYGVTTTQLNGALKDLRGQVVGTGNAVVHTSAGVGVMTGALRKQIREVLSAKTQMGFFNDALNQMSGYAVTAALDELQLKDALAAAKQQVKDHGRSLRDDTAAGRSNREWLLNQIQSVNAHAAAVYQQTGSVRAATGALRSDEGQLRRSAHAAGFNRGQVDAMIRKYEAVPSRVQTQVNLATANALRSLQNFEARLAFLSHAISIDVYANVVGITGPGGSAYSYSKHASGGMLTQGWNLIGEKGSEWAYKSGSTVKVFPHGAGGPAGGMSSAVVNNITINVNGGDPRATVRALERYFGQGGTMNSQGRIR